MPTNPYVERLVIAPEVAAALADGRAIVALESTIISHGMPYPQNVETALAVATAVRDSNAVPATIAIIGGEIKVGLDEADIRRIGQRGDKTVKTSRRDLPFVVARKDDGATTVAATMIISAMAGISVFATGGIGGVHRGAEMSMDISADLEELARTDVAVVCAGIKSILDIARTLEYLETVGVPVVGYRTDEVPAFYTTSSGFPVTYRVESASEVATAMKIKSEMGLKGGIVIAVPIPEAHAMAKGELDMIIGDAIAEMNRQDIAGKDATPYLLSRIAEATGGRSLAANIQLMLNNARVAAEIAVAKAT